MKFWLAPLSRLTVVGILALIGAAMGGAAIGWAIASVGFFALVLVQLRYLQKLQHWLGAPTVEEIPDGWGAWSDVFGELYRSHRREQKSRKQQALALDRFMQAAQALPDAVILLDAEGRIDWANAVAERQFGLDLSHDRGQAIVNLVRYPAVASYLSRADSGEPLILQTNASPPLTLSIQVVRYGESEKLMLSRDITAIYRSDTIRRDFIANVSHELRTPLTVINGYLEHMTDGALADARLAKPLALMQDQATRMARLVEDLLTLSRLEAEDNVLRDDPINMPQLVAALLDEGRALSRGRHMLLAEIDSGDMHGAADELRSAFANLVSNAIRYTPEGGRITVHWQTNEQGARFAVTDSGIGIAPEHVPRLTERFYRVDRSRSRETGGTGLGLAIVKHVLIRHQGTLEVDSALGAGSTFACLFPSARVIIKATRAAA